MILLQLWLHHTAIIHNLKKRVDTKNYRHELMHNSFRYKTEKYNVS